MSSVSIILLAAGGSSRLGTPKQLHPHQETTLLRYSSSQALASKAKSTYVILGSEAERMAEELKGLSPQIVMNPDWRSGMSTSIRAGIHALPSSVDAALIMLCDQPPVTTELLNAIITTYQSSHNPIVACEYHGTQGVPALFDKVFFPKLLQLKGDSGAKQIILDHPDQVTLIPFPDGIVDVDEIT